MKLQCIISTANSVAGSRTSVKAFYRCNYKYNTETGAKNIYIKCRVVGTKQEQC